MSYVYIRTEPELWTVGHYRPDGKFEPESDHGSSGEAAAQVRYLHGGEVDDAVDGMSPIAEDAIARMGAAEHEVDAMAQHLRTIRDLLQEEDPKEALGLIEHALNFYKIYQRRQRGGGETS